MVLSDGQHFRAVLGAGTECILFDSLGDVGYIVKELFPKLAAANLGCSFEVLRFFPQEADRNCGVWVFWAAKQLMEFTPGGQTTLGAHILSSADRQGLTCLKHGAPTPVNMSTNRKVIHALKRDLRATVIPRTADPILALRAAAQNWEAMNVADRLHHPEGVRFDLTSDLLGAHPAVPLPLPAAPPPRRRRLRPHWAPTPGPQALGAPDPTVDPVAAPSETSPNNRLKKLDPLSFSIESRRKFPVKSAG